MTVTEAFQLFKTRLELSSSLDELVQVRHNAVRSILSDHKTQLIGSIQRRTRIQPLPDKILDIDILVEMGSFVRWIPTGGTTTDMAMNILREEVRESDRYNAMGPIQDAPTITIRYSDNMEIELVPAYLDKIGFSPNGIPHSPTERAYWVANSNGKWELADYNFDAQYISDQNDGSEGYLIPAIKMLKALRRHYFPTLKSYPLEILAALLIPRIVQGMKQRHMSITYPYLIYIFFSIAPQYIGQPIKIPGSLSSAVILDLSDQVTITQVFAYLENDFESAINTQGEVNQIRAWRRIFGYLFPSI